MYDVAITFASLVKNNNGFFKSEKQAAFLLSQCQEENLFVTGGNIYRNSFTMYYFCDAQGIMEVKKYTEKKGHTSVWKRQSDVAFKASQEKMAAFRASNEKLAKDIEAAYVAREAAIGKAVEIAQNYIKAQAIQDGTPEGRAERMAARITTVSDLVDWIPELQDCESFMEVWKTI